MPFRSIKKSFLIIIMISALTISACSQLFKSKEQEPTPEDPVKLLKVLGINTFGRVYILDVLEAKTSLISFKVLQILGDNIVISFHSDAGPFEPQVNRNVISFGGHQFEFTAQPNRYKVNGTMYELSEPGKYAFSDGEYIGRIH